MALANFEREFCERRQRVAINLDSQKTHLWVSRALEFILELVEKTSTCLARSK